MDQVRVVPGGANGVQPKQNRLAFVLSQHQSEELLRLLKENGVKNIRTLSDSNAKHVARALGKGQ